MRKKDFRALAVELSDHLMTVTREFFEAKGLPFDEEAFWRQASFDKMDVANQMIWFGVDKFPIRPDEDEEPSGVSPK